MVEKATNDAGDVFESGDRIVVGSVLYTVDRIDKNGMLELIGDGPSLTHPNNAIHARDHEGRLYLHSGRDSRAWIKQGVDPCEVCGATHRHIYTHDFATAYVEECPVCKSEIERRE